MHRAGFRREESWRSPSSSQLELLDHDTWAENLAAVTPDTTSPDEYLPEGALARWLAAHQLPRKQVLIMKC